MLGGLLKSVKRSTPTATVGDDPQLTEGFRCGEGHAGARLGWEEGDRGLGVRRLRPSLPVGWASDRFAVDKKDKPHDKPSGHHPFDRVGTERVIIHRLARLFRPQTNGMVERFNRRLGDHLDRMPQNRAATTAGFSTMPNAMPISTPLSPITIAPACDASAIRHLPNSSVISPDTTPAPGQALVHRKSRDKTRRDHAVKMDAIASRPSPRSPSPHSSLAPDALHHIGSPR